MKNIMSLNLDPKCKERLIDKVAELLPNIIVQNNMFIDRESTGAFASVEPILPQKGPVRDKLNQYIGDVPLLKFLTDYLTQELYENQKYDNEAAPINLTKLDSYNDPPSVAKRLIEAFESLPWEYTLSIKIENDFSKLFSKTKTEYRISDKMRLIVPSDEFSDEFPLKSGVEARDRLLATLSDDFRGIGAGANYLRSLSYKFSPEWDRESTYLQINISGFIGKYIFSNAFDDAIALLKSFCGICLALRLFKFDDLYSPESIKANFFEHQQINNSWVIQNYHKLDISVSEIFCNLTLHDLDGRLDSEEKKIEWIERQLRNVKFIMSDQLNSARIMLGTQWFFDSYFKRNELLSFIQMIVVLEILLGDKAISDIMGLGELLRNRCAYLISKSHEQRKDLLKFFKKIYEIRSKIVHRGKNRLSLEEKNLFSILQWMCRRVIQEEVVLLKNDKKEDA